MSFSISIRKWLFFLFISNWTVVFAYCGIYIEYSRINFLKSNNKLLMIGFRSFYFKRFLCDTIHLYVPNMSWVRIDTNNWIAMSQFTPKLVDIIQFGVGKFGVICGVFKNSSNFTRMLLFFLPFKVRILWIAFISISWSVPDP